MKHQIGFDMWLPFVVTLSIWIGLIFAIAAIVSKTWADLFGLIYLLASPFIYRFLTSVVGEEVAWTEADQTRSQAESKEETIQ